MRHSFLVVLAVVTTSLSACTDGPTDPAANLPVVVRAFLKADTSLVVRSTELVFEDRRVDLSVFRVAYGEPTDCFSGCFFQSAVGVRVGDRAGWANGSARPPTTAVFKVQPGDSARFTPAVLDDLKARDIQAFSAVALSLACSPNTSATLRQKIVSENRNLSYPRSCPA